MREGGAFYEAMTSAQFVLFVAGAGGPGALTTSATDLADANDKGDNSTATLAISSSLLMTDTCLR